jgi:hypothetical protein
MDFWFAAIMTANEIAIPCQSPVADLLREKDLPQRFRPT